MTRDRLQRLLVDVQLELAKAARWIDDPVFDAVIGPARQGLREDVQTAGINVLCALNRLAPRAIGRTKA